MEDEEHVLTFYAFPPVMHRYIRSTNAHSELVEQCAAAHRSDGGLYDPNQLFDHRLGGDARYPSAKDSSRLTGHCSLSSLQQQPTEKGGSAGGVVSSSSWVAPEAPGSLFLMGMACPGGNSCRRKAQTSAYS